jgi:CRP-like cAMP-binding protein
MLRKKPSIDPALLQRFHPLSLVDPGQQKQLLKRAQVLEYRRNQYLYRKTPPAGTVYFLLDGDIEIRESFESRIPLSAGDERAQHSLNEQSPDGASIRALGDVRVLAVARDAIDMLLASPTASETRQLAAAGDAAADRSGDEVYGVDVVEDGGQMFEEARFDDDYSEDWMVRMLESPLMSCLSPADIQRCFIALERVAVAGGEDVVTAGTRGEYFYILLRGEAEVLTDPAGPFGGRRFDLVPGDHFGEEALVADTLRNATVRMCSDGEVGRISRAEFDDIVRRPLVQTIAADKAQGFLDGAGIPCRMLDVRFAAEYRHGHRDGADNLPIVQLRRSLRELDRHATYLVTPEGGRRSELAVFLLRQAGINAYLIND